jgi:hypothetical protein
VTFPDHIRRKTDVDMQINEEWRMGFGQRAVVACRNLGKKLTFCWLSLVFAKAVALKPMCDRFSQAALIHSHRKLSTGFRRAALTV